MTPAPNPAPSTRKERVRRAFRREPVDHLPFQTNYTPAMGRILAAHFGIAESDLPARLNNHLLRVDVSHPKRTSDDGTIQ